MSDISIRQDGHAGRITLTRPQALNAMTYAMCTAIEAALLDWAQDDSIALVIFDAEGERAFCAGGDIAELYATGTAGDYSYGQTFWRDEYRLNALIAGYPKPVVAFLQGFTMGGGVGLGCHARHRIVGDSSQIAMPECGIGLVPDVGGSLLLAQAPGRLGAYLALTAARMTAPDAILCGFADVYAPEDQWETLKRDLIESGSVVSVTALPAPTDGPLAAQQPWIDTVFGGESLTDIVNLLRTTPQDAAAQAALKAIGRNSPLAMSCGLEIIHRLQQGLPDIHKALELEYRFTFRAMQHGDFLEGIRAQIIDKDRNPQWRHDLDKVPAVDISKMLRPLGADKLHFNRETAQMKIGFIGLGNMGAPMASNLVAAGHAVTGFDTAGVTVEGVTQAPSASDAARGADVVITMLPNGAILRSVADEVIPAMSKGAVLLDCSTVDVESARAVAAQAEAAGLGALDAPVSGGIGGAAAGTLTFMVGGTQTAFTTAEPLFAIMGQKAVHCGPAGNGQAAKICNNMILGVTMIATCEAFALADKLGLAREAMFDVVSTSSGYSWSMNAYCPAPGVGPTSPADNGYAPGFAAELMLKDLGLSQQAAEAAKADTPMGARALALYQQFVEEEDGRGKDFSAMLPRFEKRDRS